MTDTSIKNTYYTLKEENSCLSERTPETSDFNEQFQYSINTKRHTELKGRPVIKSVSEILFKHRNDK